VNNTRLKSSSLERREPTSEQLGLFLTVCAQAISFSNHRHTTLRPPEKVAQK
jgi:hypothetical protein